MPGDHHLLLQARIEIGPDSMTPLTSFISQKDFQQFHAIDRELYANLVFNLCRDPQESMQIMAFWLWLERTSTAVNNLVTKMLSLPYTLINELADEALTCLTCVTADEDLIPSFSETSDIPLTQSLANVEISLQFLHDQKQQVAQGLSKILNEVCMRALVDIMKQAMERAQASLQHSPRVHHVGFGRAGGAQQYWPPGSETSTPPDDRTMFVTFSKGYPVLEWEIRDFLKKSYGDCMESLYMQEVQHPKDQALFARIVFRSTSTIELILHGLSKAKFTINGKHVWARKFASKRSKSSSHPPLSSSTFLQTAPLQSCMPQPTN